jgi:hypothetical protein
MESKGGIALIEDTKTGKVEELIEKAIKKADDMYTRFTTITAIQQAEITRLQSELRTQTERADRAEREKAAAIRDMAYIAGNETNGAKCNYCKWNPNDMGCELDGSQFDDDGECHFEWRGEENKGEA